MQRLSLYSVTALSALGLAVCGDGSGPAVPAQVRVTPSAQTLTVTGATVQFTAQALDKDGMVMTGTPVTWSATPVSVASVTQKGLATALASGVAEIRATAGGVVGKAILTVTLIPTDMSKTAGDEQIGPINTVLPVRPEVRVLDGGGSPIAGATVIFTILEGGGSVSPANVTTSPTGRASTDWMMGPTPGDPQRLRATVGSLTVDFTASAIRPPLAVESDVLEDGRVSITFSEALQAAGGSGLGYTWSLVGGGLPTGLVLQPSGDVEGVPASQGDFSFTVQVEDSDGEQASAAVSLKVCPAPVPMGRGEARVSDPEGPDGCGFFLPAGNAGDRYRVGIIRTKACSTSTECSGSAENDVVTAALAVRGIGVSAAPAAAAAARATERASRQAPPWLEEALEAAAATEAFHYRVREAERQLLKSLGPGGSPLPSPASPGPAQVAAAPSPARRTFHYQPGGDATCTESSLKPAWLVGENDLVAIYQDSVQRVSKPVSPTAVQAMLDHYRDYGKSIIDQYFGGVSDINNDGKVVVYVTPDLKSNVSAFVWSGDFLPRTAGAGEWSCANSNEMEVTYFSADRINAFDGGDFGAVGTLVHEAKHVSSLYKRLRGLAASGDLYGFHPSWIEEGTAEIAADRSSRLAWSQTGGPPVGSMVTEEDWSDDWNSDNWATVLKLARTVWYLSSQPNAITLNPLGAPQTHSFYGGSWHFHRWLGDAYGNASVALADSALFRLQNDSLSMSGLSLYPELTGRTFADLLEDYTAAVMLNGTGAPQPLHAFTSFDFPSSTGIFANPDPPGVYPWPVTTDESDNESVPLVSATFAGLVGESGLRVHDFESNGSGEGAEIRVTIQPPAKVVVVRLR